MSALQWDLSLYKNAATTGTINLGTIAEQQYYETALNVTGNEGTVTYRMIAGRLPPGLQIDRTGMLYGNPVVTDVNRDINDVTLDGPGVEADNSRPYVFTIRAADSKSICDRTFSITVTNIRPPKIYPRTTAGAVNLGVYEDGSYIDFQFIAYEDNPSAELVWDVVSGPNPQFVTRSTSNVAISIGSKTLTVDKNLNLSAQEIVKITYDDSNYLVGDVTGYHPTTGLLFINATQAIGSGTYGSWRVTILGDILPSGLSLSKDGKLSGYLLPNPPLNRSDKGRWDNARWDEFFSSPGDGRIPWDFVGLRVAREFQFTISVYDGESYDIVTYIMTVYPKGQLTADTTLYTADLIHVSADSSNKHRPILVNTNYRLPDARQLSYFVYKFNAIDFDGDAVQYKLNTTSWGRFDEGNIALTDPGFDGTYISGGDTIVVPFDAGDSSFPLTLTMDEDTGWIYGTLPEQIEEELTYTFQVFVYKVGEPTYRSDSRVFSLRVLGNLIDLVEWITPPNLGMLENQEISELVLETTIYNPVLNDYLIAANLGSNVVSPNVSTVSYSIESGNLPSGLELQTNGLITGRVGFDFFRLDNETTTIDDMMTTWDSTYTFTANAVGLDANANVIVSTLREFTITVDNINHEPFSDVYVKAYLSQAQRTWFTDLVNNTDIFPEELIYRSIDPYFGRPDSVKTLFNAGVTTTDMYQVALGVQQNHYNKKILFGDIKTAVALDKDFIPKYEVVYVELTDEYVNKNGESVNPSTNIASKVQQGYLTHNRSSAINEPSHYEISEFTTLYPNSFKAMNDNLINSIGYANKAAMPDWMSSVQPDGTILGFTRALVLCYLIPDSTKAPKFNSNMVASRLRKHLSDNKISLNQIEFIADRYQIDLNLENYPEVNDKYMSFPRLGVFT